MRIRNVYETNVNSRLTQIGPQFRIRKYYYAVFRCSCGEYCVVSVSEFKSSGTRSCGCLNVQRIVERNTTHGMSSTSEYEIWCGVVKRCTNTKCKAYNRYGGSGITVCERWSTFDTFYEDMGPRPTPKHSIDRIDNSKGYFPENCRWATDAQQRRNKSVNRSITAYGKTMIAADWEKVYGVPSKTISKRIRELNWAPEDAVSVPPRKKQCESKN